MLEFEVRGLRAETFVAEVDHLLRDRRLSGQKLVEAFVRHEPELHEVLIANCDFLINWVGDMTPSFAESAASLMRMLWARDADRVFTAMRAHLVERPRQSSAFLRLLHWALAARGHPRDDPLAGLSRVAPSDERALIDAYFGSDAFIARLADRLASAKSTSGALEQFAPFAPLLRTVPDALLARLVESDTWRRLTERLLCASGEEEYGRVERIVKDLIERQDASPAVSSALLRLLSSDHALYVIRFVRFLASVERIVPDDLEVLNRAIRALLIRSDEMEQPLTIIVPVALGLLAHLPRVECAIDPGAIHNCLEHRISRAAATALFRYLLALAGSNPDFRGRLRAEIKTGRFDRRATGRHVTCLMVWLWDRLAVVPGTPDEDVWADLELGHTHFEVISGDQFADDVWRLYNDWILEDGRVRACAKDFVVGLFFRTRLVRMGEQEFFASAIRALGDADAEALIARACREVAHWSRDGDSIYRAKRAAAIVRALPERAADVLARIPETVRFSFRQKTAECNEIAALLCR
jgi:hypothetical protein